MAVVVSACGGSASSSSAPVPPTPTAVTFSLNGQITDGATAVAIAGATVSVADGSNAGKSATTDASGNYSLSGLQSSGFTVIVSASGYQTFSKGTTLTASQTLSFQLARVPVAPSTFTVSGTATDGTSHGVLPNIAVQIADGANAGKSTTTDGSGTYGIAGVTPGTFTLSASAVSYETTSTQVTVSTTTRVDFVLQRVAPSCSFTVTPSHLSFSNGGLSLPSGAITLTASAPTCAWTASNAPDDWLFLQVLGSGGSYGHAVSGTGSAQIGTGAGVALFTTRMSTVKVRWLGGGFDLTACQPNC
jgi:hypothetical protein